MKRFAVLGLMLLVGGCTASTPYTRMHEGRPEPPVAMPTEKNPDAYNYLTSVLGGECSEAEYPLFASLLVQPPAQTRDLLETLGIIRDHKLDSMGDEGWMQAINLRQRLFWRKDFTTPDGPRIAWLFIRGYGGGNQGQRSHATAILTTADNQVLAFKPTTIWGAFELRPVVPAHPDATVLQVANRFDGSVGGSFPPHEFSADVIRFSASAIEVTPHENPARGFTFPRNIPAAEGH